MDKLTDLEEKVAWVVCQPDAHWCDVDRTRGADDRLHPGTCRGGRCVCLTTAREVIALVLASVEATGADHGR